MLLAVCSMALAGCTMPAPAPTATPTESATPTPTSSANASLPDGVLATGTLSGVGYETSGTVQISHEDGQISFDLIDFATATDGQIELMFSRDVESASRTCFDTGNRFSVGSVSGLPMTMSASLFESEGFSSLQSAVVTLFPESVQDCLGEVVAVAELTWNIP